MRRLRDWNRIGDGVTTLLVDSDVIYYQFWRLPSSCNGVGECIGLCSKETTSNCQIEDEEESLIEWLSDIIVRIGSPSSIPVSDEILSVVYLSVYEPLDLVSFPDQFKDVKVFSEVKGKSSCSRSSVDVVGPSRSVVKGSFYHSGGLSSGFHDINLS